MPIYNAAGGAGQRQNALSNRKSKIGCGGVIGLLFLGCCIWSALFRSSVRNPGDITEPSAPYPNPNSLPFPQTPTDPSRPPMRYPQDDTSRHRHDKDHDVW
jgi:hypothetical protein